MGLTGNVMGARALCRMHEVGRVIHPRPATERRPRLFENPKRRGECAKVLNARVRCRSTAEAGRLRQIFCPGAQLGGHVFIAAAFNEGFHAPLQRMLIGGREIRHFFNFCDESLRLIVTNGVHERFHGRGDAGIVARHDRLPVFEVAQELRWKNHAIVLYPHRSHVQQDVGPAELFVEGFLGEKAEVFDRRAFPEGFNLSWIGGLAGNPQLVFLRVELRGDFREQAGTAITLDFAAVEEGAGTFCLTSHRIRSLPGLKTSRVSKLGDGAGVVFVAPVGEKTRGRPPRHCPFESGSSRRLGRRNPE